nr:class F sortase [Allorhizocola rhizosphaerae]
MGVVGVCGVVMVVIGGVTQPPRPPQPQLRHAPLHVAGAVPLRSPVVSVPPSPGGEVDANDPKPVKLRRQRLAHSEPVRLEIPAIGVNTELLSLGVAANHEIAVPPHDRAELASWYNLGPTPGELGSAVIVGHVDSERIGPAVFFNLGRLQRGDAIHVHRRDGTRPRFIVDSVQSYPKAGFPTDLVYGGNDRALLRLVTCGGDFDRKSRNYLSNVVVFANYAP